MIASNRVDFAEEGKMIAQNQLSNAQTQSSAQASPWKTLNLLAGIAALLAVFVFRRNLGSEFVAFNGFGLFTMPEADPSNAAEWFALLQNSPFVALTLLNVFDLVEYALLGLILLAACAALWEINHGMALLAGAGGLLGIGVYFASNPVFALLALSQRYASAAGEAERAALLGAGEALLAMYEGTGAYAGLFLALTAGLILSIIMLPGQVFSKATAISGILANGFGLTYFVILPLAPGSMLLALPFVLSAPFRLAWYFLMALRLFKMR
jgi:hypothetical protein